MLDSIVDRRLSYLVVFVALGAAIANVYYSQNAIGLLPSEEIFAVGRQAEETLKLLVAAEDNDRTNNEDTEDNDRTNNEDTTAANNEPLNIIILYPDDWTHSDIGGVAPVLKTPFITNLWKEGIRFTYNAVTTSICWISRATLFTGQYTSRHGALYLFRPTPFSNPQQWKRTWPSLLQEHAGYYVGHVGKWQYQFKGLSPDTMFNFSRMYTTSDFWAFQKDGKPQHVVDKTRDDAIDFLNARPKDRPFALTVAWAPPKGGVDRQQGKDEFIKLYEDAFFPEPFNQTHAYSLLPDFLQDEKSEARVRWNYRWDGRYQESMKVFYSLLTQVDAACKEVIDVVKEQGIYNRTMIIFTADNGEFRAAHGLSDKWYPYQESIRVPLIIYDPRMPKKKRGSEDDSMTLNVDLASTILGAAGVAPDKTMQGRDIAHTYLPCKADDKTCKEKWRDEFFYEFPAINPKIEPSTALVRKEWKYIHWKNRGVEQLFNLVNDPLEMIDLMKHNPTKYADIMDAMRQRHVILQRKAMEPIMPGTACDPTLPAGTDISKVPPCCCDKNGKTIDIIKTPKFLWDFWEQLPE